MMFPLLLLFTITNTTPPTNAASNAAFVSSSLELCNPVLSFGMPISRVPLITLSFVILTIFVGMLFQTLRQKAYGKALGLLFILAGGITNTLNRLIFGCVHDFLPFFGLFQNNIADWLITIGTVILIISLFQKHPQHKI